MTNKGSNSDDHISIIAENDTRIVSKKRQDGLLIKNGDIINDEDILVEMFNKYYVHVVENSTKISPTELGNPSDASSDGATVEEILIK